MEKLLVILSHAGQEAIMQPQYQTLVSAKSQKYPNMLRKKRLIFIALYTNTLRGHVARRNQTTGAVGILE